MQASDTTGAFMTNIPVEQHQNSPKKTRGTSLKFRGKAVVETIVVSKKQNPETVHLRKV